MKQILYAVLTVLLVFGLISCGDDKTVDPNGDTPPVIVYETFGGDGEDWGTSIKQAPDKSYVICGSTDSFGSGKNTLYLLNINTAGELVWGNLLGGDGDDNGEELLVMTNGDIVVGGVSSSFSASHDFYLVKTDSNGDKIWEKNYGDPNLYEWATSLKETTGGFALGGYTSGAPSTDQFYLVKTDLNGNLVWDSTYGTADIDWCFDMDVTADNGYIMAGYTRVYGTSVNSPYFVKTDANGNKLWDKKITETNSNTYIKSVTTVSDGGYVAGGHHWAFSGNNEETYLIKLNSDGTIAWRFIYNTVRPNLICEDIVECPDGSLLLTGSPIHTLGSTGNIVVMKVGADGTFLWTKQYEPLGNCNSMTLDIDGNLLITGFDYSDISLQSSDVMFLSIPADSL